MTNKITKSFTTIWIVLILAVATAISVSAQAPTQKLVGVIGIPKEFGMVPHGAGSKLADSNPCESFYVAALDPDNRNRVITADRANQDHGRVVGEFFTCRYSITVPANKRLYVIAGMGSTVRLPEQTRDPHYITDAWIGGTNNKPRRGYERGFAGKFVTLRTTVKATYLRFDIYYAQVDPN